MYASSVPKGISAKRMDDRQRRNRPCILEEVISYLHYETFAFLVGTVTIEITKQAEMQEVFYFVVLFFPHGLFVCPSRPLVYAALYLITTDQPVSIQAGERGSNSYHSGCKSNNFDWDGCEVFLKDNPVVISVIEPRDVDNFLDNGVSIWIFWNPPEIEFLLTDMVISPLQMAMK